MVKCGVHKVREKMSHFALEGWFNIILLKFIKKKL